MRRIIKDKTPAFWAAFLRKHPKIRYANLNDSKEGISVRKQLHGHMVSHQKNLCCYCCRIIDVETSHNEHILPQHHFPQFSMDYNNLLASCNDADSCGKEKDSLYDTKNFISPLQEDCESHFRFLPDGRVIGNDKAGEKTIAALKLNSYALVTQRKLQYNQCITMAKCLGKEYVFSEYIQEKDGKLPRFVDMVTYFYNEGYFDPDIMNSNHW